MSEYHYFLNGDTLPPPKFVPSSTGPILIFGSYNTRGYFHSERVFKNFGDLPTSSHLTSVHLKNVHLDGRGFSRQLRKIDVSRVESIILENVSLAPNSNFLSVELPALKKYVLQCSHQFGQDTGGPPAPAPSSAPNGKKQVVSAADLCGLLFFERASCKKKFSWKTEDPKFELDKDIKIMFNNLLHFETRLEERLLYTCVHPSEDIISMYSSSPLERVVVHRLDANSCILKRILPSCIKFLELTSLSWEQVEYFIANDFPSLEELVYSSYCVDLDRGAFSPTAVSMVISTLPKSLKRLSLSGVGLWLSNSSAKTVLDSLTIHNSRLENTFENNVLEKLAPKKLLFLGTTKFLRAPFLAKLLGDDALGWIYVEADCVDWGAAVEEIPDSAIIKLQKFVETVKRSEFDTLYTGQGPPTPIFLEREKFANPFQYLMARNPGKERWIMREGFCGEALFMAKSFQGFPSDDQRRWRDPVTRTEEMEGGEGDGYFALRYANIETQVEIPLRLVDVWKSELELGRMKRVDLIGFTMQEEELSQLFEQVGPHLETFVFDDIRVSRAQPGNPALPCEPGFSPRCYVPLDLSLVPKFVQNLTLTNTWAEFKGDGEVKGARELQGLCLYGKLNAAFWIRNLANYFRCRVVVLGSLKLRDKDKMWWDPVTSELLSEAGKTGANFIFVYGYKDKSKSSTGAPGPHPPHRLLNGYSGWEKDFLLVKEEYLNSFRVIRLDSKETSKLLLAACSGKFRGLEDSFKALVAEEELSKKVRDTKNQIPPSPESSPFLLDYRLESEPLPDDNKWPKTVKPVEFFGFGIFSRPVQLTSIHMYNVQINAETLIQQLGRGNMDLSSLERIEILCTQLDGKFPAVPPPLDFPSLTKFVFKLRSNAIVDVISMGHSKYSTWKDIAPFLFFTKKGRQLLPENLLQMGIDLEVSYFDEKILYYNGAEAKLICLVENYNQILDDVNSATSTNKLLTLGIKSDLDLVHQFPFSLRSLFLDVLGLAWGTVEDLVQHLPSLESLYYFQVQPGPGVKLKKLPTSLKSLELASSVNGVENLVVDFDFDPGSTPLSLDFISFSGCSLARPELRYELGRFIQARRWRIDIDDFYGVGQGYKLISVLLREEKLDGMEELSWINRNYNDIPETREERWEQCQREEKSLTWEEFKIVEDLVGGGGVEGEMGSSGGWSNPSSSSSSRKETRSSFGGPSVSMYDAEGKEYKDWVQLVKIKGDEEAGKWKGNRVARIPALEEVWYTSEVSFNPVGKWRMKVIELKL